MKNFRMDGGWANTPEPAKRASSQQVCVSDANTWGFLNGEEGVKNKPPLTP